MSVPWVLIRMQVPGLPFSDLLDQNLKRQGSGNVHVGKIPTWCSGMLRVFFISYLRFLVTSVSPGQ